MADPADNHEIVLKDCIVQTGICTHNTTVKQAMQTCVRSHVAGIPYLDEDGRIIGRFSLRNTFYAECIPADLIKHAHLLGENIENFEISDHYPDDFLQLPARNLLVEQVLHLSPESQIVKALALMEQFGTTYLFVVDDDNTYLGTVTHLSIAEQLTR